MTLPGGGKKNWLLPIAVSLLLHAPVVILLSLAQPGKAIPEPDLRLSLRSAPSIQKAAPRPAETREAGPRTEQAQTPRQQEGPRPAPKPEETKKTAAASKPGTAGGSPARENTAPAEDVINRNEAAPAPVKHTPGQTGGASPSPGPVELSRLKIIKEVVPDYPAFSRKRGEEGEVRIIVTIKGGAVAAAEVYESSGHKRLDQSALRAAKLWRFAEAEDVLAVIPFVFSLTD